MVDAATEKKRTISGMVVSDASDKTISVRIDRRVRHPLYGKIIGRSSKLQVHDEHNEANVGDRVSIQECRPMSKTKSWKLVEIEERVQQADS
ncbi:MAG: 30S ribosomal protein S17 [Gammaproteobacteria bacterium]|nr:30S ribosomal protein S17 [Gammaproteobacteria bacterium]MXX95718.1 30S ribosomal protein S17 [Gammaproteobacteria bacterium]MYF53335.1 30S ribosomal protein S17 [Gammaproteobacteria bacterium]MYK44463.1 30S ribosomal protein S17 [Gammaproteobacteria bacterium]